MKAVLVALLGAATPALGAAYPAASALAERQAPPAFLITAFSNIGTAITKLTNDYSSDISRRTVDNWPTITSHNRAAISSFSSASNALSASGTVLTIGTGLSTLLVDVLSHFRSITDDAQYLIAAGHKAQISDYISQQSVGANSFFTLLRASVPAASTPQVNSAINTLNSVYFTILSVYS